MAQVHKRANTGRGRLMGAALCLALALPGLASAQDDGGNPFAPVVVINGLAITQYEVDQRALFLSLLRAPGDPQEEALKALTQDRLAASEARRLGFRLTPANIRAGMEEFASRANLPLDAFMEELDKGGVAPETFRDFVSNGLLWRELVQGRFGPIAAASETEVDRAITEGTQNKAMRFLLAEIVLPVQDGDAVAAMDELRALRAEIDAGRGFSEVARVASASPSAEKGGRIDWLSSTNLPPEISALLLRTPVGGVSDPITLPEAVMMFQVLDYAPDTSVPQPPVEVEYAELLLPNTPDVEIVAKAISNRAQRCTDLYAEVRGQAERLSVKKVDAGALPSDVAQQLATLDAGEYSLALGRGSSRVFLMLCSRQPKVVLTPEQQTELDKIAAEAVAEGKEPPVPQINRQDIGRQIVNAEIEKAGAAWLEELKSEAIIVTP